MPQMIQDQLLLKMVNNNSFQYHIYPFLKLFAMFLLTLYTSKGKCHGFLSMFDKIGLLMVTSILVAIVSLLFITFGTGVFHQGNTSLTSKYTRFQ